MSAQTIGAGHEVCSTHRSYQLTCVEYDGMVSSQGGACGVCTGVNGTRLVIDHDHALGRAAVRGLVCHYCNTGPLAMTDSGRWGETDAVAAYKARAWHLTNRPGLVPPMPRRGKPTMVMRSIRVSLRLWIEARAEADEREENISDVIREALERYVRRG